MAIFTGSRYVGGEIIAAPDYLGVLQVSVKRAPVTDPSILEHVVANQFTRLDLLAQQLFGDPTQWWRIADANPTVAYPDEFTPGLILAVPNANPS